MSPLICVSAESLAGLDQKVEEWEELEIMVDSRAGHTVVCPEQVKTSPQGSQTPRKFTSWRMAA